MISVGLLNCRGYSMFLKEHYMKSFSIIIKQCCPNTLTRKLKLMSMMKRPNQSLRKVKVRKKIVRVMNQSIGNSRSFSLVISDNYWDILSVIQSYTPNYLQKFQISSKYHSVALHQQLMN